MGIRSTAQEKGQKAGRKISATMCETVLCLQGRPDKFTHSSRSPNFNRV